MMPLEKPWIDKLSPQDLNQLYSDVYTELRLIAGRLMAYERADHSLQPTVLVHEVFLRLGAKSKRLSRCEFLAVAATIMRNVLVDHARSRAADKRGGGALRFCVSSMDLETKHGDFDLVELNDALTCLAREAPRAEFVLRLRLFGLSKDETAEAVGISKATLDRDMHYARCRMADILGVR